MRGYLSLRQAWRCIASDQAFLAELHTDFRIHSPWVAVMTNPGLSASFRMRLASDGNGLVGRIARLSLRWVNSIHVSPGARLGNSLYLPHPQSIVIGERVQLGGQVTIFQGVTLGRGAGSGYPRVEEGVVLYPNSVIVGSIVLGRNSRVGATCFVSRDVGPEITIRASKDQDASRDY